MNLTNGLTSTTTTGGAATSTVTITDTSTSTTVWNAEVPLDPELRAINGFRIFISTIGILANIIVILSVLISKEFKKRITDWYILQLAIADTAFLITLPFQLVEDQHNAWIFPVWMCKASEGLLFINYYSSVAFLTIMALDRYIAICHSFSESFRKLRTHRVAYIITAVVWLISILLSLPVMIFSQVAGIKPNCRCSPEFPNPPKTPTERCIDIGLGDDTQIVYNNKTSLQGCLELYENAKRQGYCSEPASGSDYSGSASGFEPPEDSLQIGCHYIGYRSGFVAYIYFNFIVMFLVPFVIIAVCYALIIHHLNKSTFRSDRSTKSGRKKANKEDQSRKRVAIMCASLVIVFAICWLPYHGNHMAKLKGILGTSDHCRKILYATSLLVYFNSAINPFIYFIGARFKRQVKRIRSYSSSYSMKTIFTRRSHGESTVSRSGNSSTKSPIKNHDDSKVKEESTGPSISTQ